MLHVAARRVRQLMARVTFTPDPVAIHRYFNDRQKPVQVYLRGKAFDVRGLSQRLAPRGDTGNLAREIIVVAFKNGWAVFATVPYAKAVHEGTRPHVILPRTKTVLRWMSEDGEEVFARKVRHPGTRPQPFLVAALGFIIRR